jgi:hypothetical protein
MPAFLKISRVRSSDARATPTAIAATTGRVLSNVFMTPANAFFVSMMGPHPARLRRAAAPKFVLGASRLRAKAGGSRLAA